VHSYLQNLNDAQKEAVVSIEGPSLIIAGAGSGKTRVLTFRIAHLLAQSTKPSSILALTFTNKAAKEMKERISLIVGENLAKYLWMGTFHSIFAKILRIEAEAIGFPSSFTIYDSDDSKSLINSIIKELQLDPQTYKASDVYQRISSAKNNLITAKTYLNNSQIRETDRSQKKPEIGRIFEIYSQRCFRSGSMDFDDLLLNTNILFRDHPAILDKYQQKFHFVLVDEYQDTNFSQYLIIKKLAEQHKNICVVGDDAQSIYSFRGAKIENILNFKHDYPNYKLFKLEQNYRSTQTIVNAANSLIAKNKNQIQKLVFSENDPGSYIQISESQSDNEEGTIVSNTIATKHLQNHISYDDFAILYRTNAQSRIFEETLRKRNIPYKIVGGLSFYQRKEIKDLLAYFRLVVNPNDDEALKRVLNYPARGIGKTTQDKLESYANQNSISIWQVIHNPSQLRSGLNAGVVSKISEFVKLIESFQQKAVDTDVYELALQISANSGILKDLYTDKTPENINRYENVQEILNGIKEYSSDYLEQNGQPCTLDIYLQEVALLTGEEKSNDEAVEKVTMMTIHSAKGLEFSHVFVVGMEEGLFPSSMSVMSQNDIEEERRLFYVAITRAKSELFISFAKSRYRWGKLVFCTPSRFIYEIDAEFIRFENQNNGRIFDEEFSDDIDNAYSDYGTRGSDSKKSQQNTFDNLQGKIDTIMKTKKPSFDPLPANKRLIKINSSSSTSVPEVGDHVFNIEDVKQGVQVHHERFGYGKVVTVEGVGPDAKALINFNNSGQKQLLLKFAKIKIIK